MFAARRGDGSKRLVQQRVEQAAAGGFAGGKAGFQPVAQRHQFVDFGDDAVLFGEGRDVQDKVA